MRKRWMLVILLILFVAAPLAAGAYEGGAVGNGGTISGVVTYNGPASEAKELRVTKDQNACAKTPKYDMSLVVKDGKLANSVVFITNIDKGKPMKKEAVTLDQNGCEYQPHVLAVPAGVDVAILNPDRVLHNIHTYSKVNAPMNRAQPKFKKKLTVKFDKPEIMEVKCDVHGWMNGWIFVAGNPYYSVTGGDGAFQLTDVPPGTYQVEVWHETLGKQTKEVTVKAGEDSKTDFEFSKS